MLFRSDVLSLLIEADHRILRQIADMLIGKRDFVLPESEQEEETPAGKRSYRKALKGFLTTLAVNVCVAIIIAVLRAVL